MKLLYKGVSGTKITSVHFQAYGGDIKVVATLDDDTRIKFKHEDLNIILSDLEFKVMKCNSKRNKYWIVNEYYNPLEPEKDPVMLNDPRRQEGYGKDYIHCPVCVHGDEFPYGHCKRCINFSHYKKGEQYECR